MTTTRTTRRKADRPEPAPTTVDTAPTTVDTAPTTVDTAPTTVDTAPDLTTAASVAAFLLDLYRTTAPTDRRAVLSDLSTVAAIAAHRDDADVLAAYALAASDETWSDPWADQVSVMAAAWATIDACRTVVDPADWTTVVGRAIDAAPTVDAGTVARVIAVTAPTTARRTRGGGTTRATRTRDAAAVIGRTFTYCGATVVVADDGSWNIAGPGGAAYATPSAAARAVNGGTAVNGWRDAWRDADGHTPDDYATA